MPDRVERREEFVDHPGHAIGTRIHPAGLPHEIVPLDPGAEHLPGPHLARGRGERVEPIEAQPLRWQLLSAPFAVRTADAFRWWDEDGLAPGPDPAAALAAAAAGDMPALAGSLFNDLEEPVARRHPEVRSSRDRLLAAGAVAAVMCGSGPTVAGLFLSAPAGAGVGLPVRSAGRLRT